MTGVKEPKRSRGKPPLAGEPGERYQVYLPQAVAEKLRKLGDGSISLGVVRTAQRILGLGK